MALWYILPAIIWIPLGIYIFHVTRRILTLFHLDKKEKISNIISLILTLCCVRWGMDVIWAWSSIDLSFSGSMWGDGDCMADWEKSL